MSALAPERRRTDLDLLSLARLAGRGEHGDRRDSIEGNDPASC